MSSPRSSSVRVRLLMLVLAASAPLLAFAAALLANGYGAGTELLRQNAMGLVRASTLAIEGELGQAQAALAALSTSDRLQADDFVGLEAQAVSMLSRLDIPGATVTLTDRGGRTLMRTLSVPDQALPRRGVGDAPSRMFATGKTQFSDLYIGGVSHEARVSVETPVLRNGEVLYDLSMAVPASALTAVLLAQRLPAGWLAAVFDLRGVTVARTLNAGTSVGQPGAPDLLAAMAAQPQGFAQVSAREGQPVFLAYVRSAVTGWTVTLGVPVSAVETPLRRSVAWLAIGGVGFLLAAMGLAWAVARRIALPMEELARQAARLGRGEPPEAPVRGVAEVEAAGRALADAAALIANSRATLHEAAAGLESEVRARTKELAESEARFRSYFDHAAEPMFVVRVDPDGTFVYAALNRADQVLTGLRPDGFVGCRPEECLFPQTAQAVLAHYRACVAEGEPRRYTTTLELPNGLRELDTVLIPVRDGETGRITHLIGGLRDMTERRKLQEQLAQAQKMEAVGQLTGGVAHDFNNLLTIVAGNLDLLRRRVTEDPRSLRYLDAVRQAVDRGARLTASLLAFSRRQVLRPEAVDAGVLLGESASLLRRTLGRMVDLKLDVAPGLPPCRADAGQLEAAVLNLALNARDAMPRGGQIVLRARTARLRAADLAGNDDAQPGPYVAIEVSDTGEGMDAAVRARAFEPFFTTKDVGRGSGLGLSQVYGFVRQVGGHVTLDSAPGRGTTVRMFLPVEGADVTEAAADPAVPEGQGAIVLVVEDDTELRAVVTETLRHAGYRVLTAGGSADALAALQGSQPIDVLFTDVVLPSGLDGVDLARAARAVRPTLAVLLTSGYAATGPASPTGMAEFDVLSKPYDTGTLLQRMSALTEAADRETQRQDQPA